MVGDCDGAGFTRRAGSRATVQRGATLTNAEEYLVRGWMPLPIKLREKRPNLGREWEKRVIDSSNVATYFNCEPSNIGIRLGSASDGLVDIDLDCPEARIAAQYLLPPLQKIPYGRKERR